MASILRYTASSSSSLLRGFSTSIRRASEAASGSAAATTTQSPASQPSRPAHVSRDPSTSTFQLDPTRSSELMGLFQNVELPDSPAPLSAVDKDAAWWRSRSHESSHSRLDPGNQYSGRSIPVSASRGNTARGFAKQYRQLGGILARSNIRRELKIAEFYEKPSDRRRRVESERHRRRFQELVRTKVQLVQAIRNRD